MKTFKRYLPSVPLALGVVINLVFYFRGFGSFGFLWLIAALLSVGLLSFEIINRLHLLIKGGVAPRVIFFILITFSVLFNLSGFASSVLTTDQENEHITAKGNDQEETESDTRTRIEELKARQVDINKNLTFYSYKTGQYEPVTPIIERAWERAGTVEPGEIQGYRDKSAELSQKIDGLYNSLGTTSKEYVLQKKNIFDLLSGTPKEIVRIIFFLCLSVLIALMPSMNLKYFYVMTKRGDGVKKIDPLDISIIGYVLWFKVTKDGFINTMDSIRGYYKNNLMRDFEYHKEVKAALQKMENVVLYKDEKRPDLYKPMKDVTKEVFYKKLEEVLRG